MTEDHSYLWIAPLGTPAPKKRGWLRRLFTRRGEWQFVGEATTDVKLDTSSWNAELAKAQAEASRIELGLSLPGVIVSCDHSEPWGYDDRGNHWCREMRSDARLPTQAVSAVRALRRALGSAHAL